MTLNITKYRVTFIQTYAPEQGRPGEEKEHFHEQLQDTLGIPNDSDIIIIIIIIMGDFNCHISNEAVDGVIGKFSIGQRN